MNKETVLTGDDIDDATEQIYGTAATHQELQFARAIEQAVLQSPEIRRLREDSDKYQILRMAVPKIIADKVREALEGVINAIESCRTTGTIRDGTIEASIEAVRALIPKP